jgi:uroporphyrin-III C-methyltransferase
VGAGPGAADLLTLRGRDRLAAADVVVYDDLVAPETLALAPPAAERIYVGKRAGRHHLTQAEISRLLVALARTGRRVVRLKGGDPFVFGRGGEEAAELRAAGIPVDVVPGVTAAFGAAAESGVPLTHRAHASAVVFVTGHECAGKTSPGVDWAALVASRATLCIYMGARRAAALAQELRLAGASPDLPVAIIAHATLAAQQVTLTTLAGLAEAPQAAVSPSILIVGEVVRESPLHQLQAIASQVRAA